MKTPRIYIDTSVIGGCFDPEFATWSNQLMDHFRSGRYIAVLSDVTEEEVDPAPQNVRNLYAELLDLPALVLETTPEVLELAASYAERSVLSAKFENDMLHVALVTVAGVDVLVSWNFRHIVRWDKIRLFNAVNIEQGYRTVSIHSPQEVLTYGNDD